MSDNPNEKSIKGFILALEIMAKYLGEVKKYFLDAEHDEIYSDLSAEDCPEDSEDGKMLDELGWFVGEFGNWDYFT